METFTRRGSFHARLPVVVALLATGALAAGCGGGSSYKNNPRPPAPINVSAAIVGHSITVSPNKFGAGQIVLIVSNLSSRSQTVTIERGSRSSDASCEQKQTAGPINPSDAAPLKINTCPGTYQLAVTDPSIHAATLTVGAERPSAQNLVLQP